MAGQAFLAEVGNLVCRCGGIVDDVAGDTSQLAMARLVALAHFKRGVLPPEGSCHAPAHGRKRFQSVGFGALLRLQGEFEYRNRFIERRSGPEIQVVFPGLQDPRVPALVAIHADVIRQTRGEPRRIYDGSVGLAGMTATLCRPFLKMELARAVTAFAP